MKLPFISSEEAGKCVAHSIKKYNSSIAHLTLHPCGKPKWDTSLLKKDFLSKKNQDIVLGK